jgi:hypothetical protein
MIEATSKLTYEEWAEAQDVWCKPRSAKLPYGQALKFIYYALCGLVGIALVTKPCWIGAGIFVCLLLQSWIVTKRKEPVRRSLYERSRMNEHESNVTVDEMGYASIRPGFAECRMSWKTFSGWNEGKLTFILGRELQYCSVPKRALTESQISELRILLKNHIRNAV